VIPSPNPPRFAVRRDPVSAPPPPRPAPVDARQLVADTLTEIAVRLDTRQQTVDSLTYALQSNEVRDGGLTDRAIVALIAAAYADSEQTAALLDDLAGAATRLERHRAISGHDECCGGECLCIGSRSCSCRDCEDGPADSLWQAQADLICDLERLRSLPHLLRAAQDTT